MIPPPCAINLDYTIEFHDFENHAVKSMKNARTSAQ